MATEYWRINLLIGNTASLASISEEGTPAIWSDKSYRLGWFVAGSWKYAALSGGSETFSALTLTGLTANNIPRANSSKALVPGSINDTGTAVTCTVPLTAASVARSDGAKYQAKLVASTAALVTVPGSWYTVAACIGASVGMARVTVIDNDSTLGRSVLEFIVPTGTVEDTAAFELISGWQAPRAWDAARLVVDGSVSRFQLRAKGVTTTGRDYFVSVEDVITNTASAAATAVAFELDAGTGTVRKELYLDDGKTSAVYVKATDTTIGPGATAKASLLNGGVAAGGFAAASDPIARFNKLKAKSRTELAGVVTTVTNQILTFELYRNGASVVTLTTPARSYGTGTPWRLVIKQTVRVSGTSGTVRVLMRFYCTADNANSAASCYATEVTLTGVNLTVAQTWDVVCTIPNNAGNQITCQDAEKIG